MQSDTFADIRHRHKCLKTFIKTEFPSVSINQCYETEVKRILFFLRPIVQNRLYVHMYQCGKKREKYVSAPSTCNLLSGVCVCVWMCVYACLCEHVFMCVCVCVCVCCVWVSVWESVCMCERERCNTNERENILE